MNRDLRVLAIILSPISPRFERLFWRLEIGSLEGDFGFFPRNFWNHVLYIPNIVWIVIYAFSRSFWAQTGLYLRDFLKAQNWLLGGPFWVFGQKRWKSCTNHGKYCINRDLRVTAIIFSPNSTRFQRLLWRQKIGSLQGHFGFFAQNAANHVQNIANIVWIVIYACSRSFWAQTRLDLREFFDAAKLAPWKAILGFWPKTLEIMYKTLLILYESLSTRWRDHFEPNLDSIWENFFTAQNWLIGGPFWVFGTKRWKSCTKHC